MNKEMKILDLEIIDEFSKRYSSALNKDNLKSILVDADNKIYKANIIHSAIIWIRQCVNEINKSKAISGSKELIDLLGLFSLIDILIESTDQIYRVLYKEKGGVGNKDRMSCFKDVSEPYNELSDKMYFKELRALFGAHAVNIKAMDNNYQKRYADTPRNWCRFANIKFSGKEKGDFYTKAWTPTKNDKDTIYIILRIKELEEFAKKRYALINMFTEKLNEIINDEYYIKRI